jgi:hypothetical protein
MNDTARTIENIGAEIGQPVHFMHPVGHVTQEDRDVVIGIRTRVTPSARAIKHKVFNTVAIDFRDGAAKP